MVCRHTHTHTDDTDTHCQSRCLHAAVHAAVTALLTGHKGTCYSSSCKRDARTKEVLREQRVRCARSDADFLPQTHSHHQHKSPIKLPSRTFTSEESFPVHHFVFCMCNGCFWFKVAFLSSRPERLWTDVSSKVEDFFFYRYSSRLHFALYHFKNVCVHEVGLI